jgi:hypothetical protein
VRTICVAVALLFGCSQAPSAESWREPIVGGEASGAEQDGVLLLRGVLPEGGETLCTATLIAPNLVVTAQHCISYLSNGLFSCSVRGEVIALDEGAGTLGLSLPADELEFWGGKPPRKAPVAHGKSIVSAHSTTICQNDLAFVVLDRELDLPISPVRRGRPAQKGELGVLVGYGLDADERSIDHRTQEREQKRELEILGVGPDSLAEGVTVVPPRALIMDGPSGCIGDSGGPLFAESTAAVLGVYSLQVGEDCGAPQVRHQLTHLPPFELLMDEAFEAAGATPTLELDPNDLGSAGASSGGAASEPSPIGASERGCAVSPASRRRAGGSGLVLLAALALGAWRRRS